MTEPPLAHVVAVRAPGGTGAVAESFFSGAPWLVACLFLVAGVLHFVAPNSYMGVMPRWVPEDGVFGRRALVLASGACEILGAVGVLYRPTRAAAGWGLILLLAAVFPANVRMLLDALRADAAWWARLLLMLRLPMQPALMWWVWASAVRR